MLFCPNCASVLQIDKASTTSFSCPRCPYVYYIEGEAYQYLQQKPVPVQQVISEDYLYDGAKVREPCYACGNDMAYCIMFQTRSSDEPMTRFFMCCKCKARWKNDY